MANLCEKTINACIAQDCENPLFAGVAGEALIMNKSQIDSFTYDASNGNIVTAITMSSDASSNPYGAYTVQQLGKTPYEGSQVEMAEGTYSNKFNNTVQFAILDNGPKISHDIIDNLANGSFVVIMENDYRHTNGDNRFQIYGTAKGLKASSITRELYGDNESAYIVTLVEEGNPKSGVFFYTGSDASTAEAIEALKADCE